MNVYDFDKTIYKKDCTIEFYLFCIRKRPSLALCILPQTFAAGMYLINAYSKTRFKEKFFCFLKYIEDVDAYVEQFWEKENGNISEWYLRNQRENDVIVSASPEFLVSKETNRLGIEYVIASEVDKKSGKFLSENCYGEEKEKRFRREFPIDRIDEFYSDSKSDEALASIAQRAYLVDDEEIYDWDALGEKKLGLKELIEFCRYGFWGVITTVLNLFLFYIFIKCGMKYIISNVVSYFIAVIVSYLFNKKFVFESVANQKKREIFQVIKFFVVRVLSISIDSGLLWISVDMMGIDVFFSKIVISVLVILFTYFLNKSFVFEQQEAGNGK